MKALSAFLSLVFAATIASGQNTLSGTVQDSATGAPLPFAHIILNDGHTGTTSDLNGAFTLESARPINSVTARFVGYDEKRLKIEGQAEIVINLVRSENQLQEVTILPGENPADGIIRNVVANRKKNDPERLKSFSYQAYEKFHFTLVEDSSHAAKTATDSMANVIRGLIDRQHMMLTENVYERKFRNGKYTDNVKGTRFSGMKNPEFALLAGQLQSFSFYKNEFQLGEQAFVNPISPKSEEKYFFNIEDTLNIEGDTTIVISYRPKRGKNFSALEGILHINKPDYAIRNATAHVVDQVGIEIDIKHRYELVDSVWFPTQMNTEFTGRNFNVNGFMIKGIGRTYNREIDVDAEVKAMELSVYSVEMEGRAHKMSEEEWAKVRETPLTVEDSLTYVVIDSIGNEFKFDRRINLLIAFATGRWPIGPIDLDLDKIIDFNEYEGFRLGVGIHTSPNLVKWMDVGGYVAYGFKDKEVKYGGDAAFTLLNSHALKLEGTYYHDVLESGGQWFIQQDRVNLREKYRDLIVRRFELVNGWRAGFSVRPVRGIRLQAAFKNQQVFDYSGFGYIDDAFTGDTVHEHNYTEAVLGLHWAPREKVFRLRGRDLIQDKGPIVIWLSATKGFSNILSSDFDYWKADLRIQGKFKIRKLGREYWQLRAGWVGRDLPYFKMFTPRANYEPFSAFSPGSFETMRNNEFVNRYFVAIHHQHNFGTWNTGKDAIQPEFNWVNNIGFGWMPGNSSITGNNIRPNDKGLYETGVVIENILKSTIGGIGGGVFYRYGPYSFGETLDNFAFKVSIKLGL